MASSPYTLSSPFSEVDNLSDSDWLDIASNRGSSIDNDDSGSDFDRDDELSSMPLSRRSSISLGSSRDGEIDAWEGFVDEVDHNPQELGLVVPTAVDTERELVASVDVSESTSVGRELEDEEELRVKAALDQSMVSTLSASRTSSSGLNASTTTAHNSLHDLRLSFPDPLTSSRDELTGSYERVSEADTSLSTPEDNTEAVAEPEAVQVHPSEKPHNVYLPESTVKSQLILDRLNNIKFEIVLYGNSSEIKWTFVDMLLQKMAAGGGWITMATSQDHSTSRWFSIEQFVADKYQHTSWIAVHDRTGDVPTPSPSFIRAHSSLAIIYLPSFVPPALPRHNLYLPVFVPFPSLTDPIGSGDLARRAAQDTWDLLDIPNSKVLRLKGKNYPAIFDSQDIYAAEPRFVYLALQQLVKKPLPGFSVALITVISLILGVIMNSVFRTSAPTPTIPTNLSIRPSGHLTIQTTSNDVVQVSRVAPTNSTSAIVPSSIKDFALAIISPSTTSLSVRRAAVTSLTPVIKPCGKHSHTSTLALRESPREIMVRPSSSVSSLAGPSQPQVAPSAAKFVTTTTASYPSSLSVRLVDSLAQIYGDAAKAVIQVVSQDMREIIEALDALLQAIGNQTAVIVKKSKSKASVLREHLNYRNERAKKKAKELKDMGDKLMSYAGEQLKERAIKAKKRAHKLRDTFAKSKTLKACWKAHEDTTGKIVKELTKHSDTMRAVAKAHVASKDKIVRGLADRTRQRRRVKAKGKGKVRGRVATM